MILKQDQPILITNRHGETYPVIAPKGTDLDKFTYHTFDQCYLPSRQDRHRAGRQATAHLIENGMTWTKTSIDPYLIDELYPI